MLCFIFLPGVGPFCFAQTRVRQLEFKKKKIEESTQKFINRRNFQPKNKWVNDDNNDDDTFSPVQQTRNRRLSPFEEPAS